MTNASSGECVLVTGSAKPKEELKNKGIQKHAIFPTNHLECHHLVDNVSGKHLEAATIFLKKFLLEISERKT